jgi:hypothetical protein
MAIDNALLLDSLIQGQWLMMMTRVVDPTWIDGSTTSIKSRSFDWQLGEALP